MDSLVCAEELRVANRLAGCVFVDYGHPAQIVEGWKAFAYCGSRKVPLVAVHAFGLDLGDMGHSAGARVVPSRNACLLSLAANIAGRMGAGALVIGATATDQRDYPDCRPAFFAPMSAALGIQILAPLVHLDKRGVVARARELGLQRSETWSCYGPGPDPCGACPCCLNADAAWAVES